MQIDIKAAQVTSNGGRAICKPKIWSLEPGGLGQDVGKQQIKSLVGRLSNEQTWTSWHTHTPSPRLQKGRVAQGQYQIPIVACSDSQAKSGLVCGQA